MDGGERIPKHRLGEKVMYKNENGSWMAVVLDRWTHFRGLELWLPQYTIQILDSGEIMDVAESQLMYVTAHHWEERRKNEHNH